MPAAPSLQILTRACQKHLRVQARPSTHSNFGMTQFSKVHTVHQGSVLRELSSQVRCELYPPIIILPSHKFLHAFHPQPQLPPLAWSCHQLVTTCLIFRGCCMGRLRSLSAAISIKKGFRIRICLGLTSQMRGGCFQKPFRTYGVGLEGRCEKS